MQFIYDNWSLIVAVIMVAIYFILSGEQSVKKWLLYAVTMAEREMKSGTGRIKLVTCYEWFVQRYPIFSKIIPFVVFSVWVDSALKEMKHLLETNEAIAKYVDLEEVK